MDVLVIDDDVGLQRTMRLALEALGHRVFMARDSVAALELAALHHAGVALLDLRLGREQGLDLLRDLLRLAPGLAVVVVTAFATIETAVEAMRRGAFDYLAKPFTPETLRAVLDRVARVRRLQSRVSELEEQVRAAVPEADLATRDPVMQQALDVAFRAAPSDAGILLRGESGTGKGIVAHAIHARSSRADGPFVTVHCPSLSVELLESELFGHVKGAFTGAIRDTVGKVGLAEGGTLFLDEVGDLPPPLQPKLLRLLQEKQYERVGDPLSRSGDVRIIAATNHPLEVQIAAGRFREDLFYRLNVIEVALPPLRQRTADLLPLAERLLAFFAAQAGKAITGFTAEATSSIQRYPWPGNVRELRNALERAVILAAGTEIGLADLPPALAAPLPRDVQVGAQVSLEHLEAEHIRRILQSAATIEEAATILGIDPSTLYRKRKKYGL
jgi:NtrC-family two-component system response regulator AlgB